MQEQKHKQNYHILKISRLYALFIVRVSYLWHIDMEDRHGDRQKISNILSNNESLALLAERHPITVSGRTL